MLWVGIGVCTFTLIPLQASQDQNILLKKLIVSTVPLYGILETINLFVLCFELGLDQVSFV